MFRVFWPARSPPWQDNSWPEGLTAQFSANGATVEQPASEDYASTNTADTPASRLSTLSIDLSTSGSVDRLLVDPAIDLGTPFLASAGRPASAPPTPDAFAALTTEALEALQGSIAAERRSSSASGSEPLRPDAGPSREVHATDRSDDDGDDDETSLPFQCSLPPSRNASVTHLADSTPGLIPLDGDEVQRPSEVHRVGLDPSSDFEGRDEVFGLRPSASDSTLASSVKRAGTEPSHLWEILGSGVYNEEVTSTCETAVDVYVFFRKNNDKRWHWLGLRPHRKWHRQLGAYWAALTHHLLDAEERFESQVGACELLRTGVPGLANLYDKDRRQFAPDFRAAVARFSRELSNVRDALGAVIDPLKAAHGAYSGLYPMVNFDPKSFQLRFTSRIEHAREVHRQQLEVSHRLSDAVDRLQSQHTHLQGTFDDAEALFARLGEAATANSSGASQVVSADPSEDIAKLSRHLSSLHRSMAELPRRIRRFKRGLRQTQHFAAQIGLSPAELTIS